MRIFLFTTNQETKFVMSLMAKLLLLFFFTTTIISAASSPPPPPPPHHQLNYIIDALIGAGDFTSWANKLSSADPTAFPVWATFFIPSDSSEESSPAVDRMAMVMSYHIVPQRLSLSEQCLWNPLTRLPTFVPTKSVLITNNSISDFTLHDSIFSHPHLYTTSTFAVHGIQTYGAANNERFTPPPQQAQFTIGSESDATCLCLSWELKAYAKSPPWPAPAAPTLGQGITFSELNRAINIWAYAKSPPWAVPAPAAPAPAPALAPAPAPRRRLPSLSLSPPPPPAAQSANWMVLTWPVGYCLYYDCVETKIPKQAIFIVHGLWPVDSNGNVLAGQPISDRKERIDISNMVQNSGTKFGAEMDQFWPSLHFEGSNLGFWLHEWNEHGTQQRRLNLKGYFHRTIDVAVDTDLLRTLIGRGVKPSDSKAYPHKKYMAAIRSKTKGLGDPAVLLCNQRADNVLSEVAVCLNIGANAYIPCQVPQNHYGLCDVEKDIWLLPHPIK